MKMSPLVPIGVIAGTPQPDIPAEASSEIPVSDAVCNKEDQAEKCEATTKQYDVIHIEQSSMITSELPCIEVETSNEGHAARQKRNEVMCNHENFISFVQEDTPSYFTSSHCAANEDWPCKCFNRDVHFGGVSYKVSSKRPVMVCENAIKMDHECSCAYCIDCFNMKISSQMKPSQRVRRAKQQCIY